AFAARNENGAPEQILLRFGEKPPVVSAAQQFWPGRRNVDVAVQPRAPGLEEQHAGPCILGQAMSEQTTARAGADDHVVVHTQFLRCAPRAAEITPRMAQQRCIAGTAGSRKNHAPRRCRQTCERVAAAAYLLARIRGGPPRMRRISYFALRRESRYS